MNSVPLKDRVVRRFLWFVRQRFRIYLKRKKGLPRPWTDDSILDTYRFCNVYRELDTVTQWIGQQWRTPHEDYRDLWFAIVVGRFLNRPTTLAQLALPGRWDRGHFLRVMATIKKSGTPIFNGAYIVSTNGIKMDKVLYLADRVFGPLWERRKDLRPTSNDTLAEYHATLMTQQGMGSFMAAQVVADLKYASPLKDAADWWTFAASGPGSRRGLNRIRGRAIKTAWPERVWKKTLRRLQNDHVNAFAVNKGMPAFHAQDIQNCLCEYDKFERARLGEGRPKQLFKSSK
jgi:hypothetical protein